MSSSPLPSQSALPVTQTNAPAPSPLPSQGSSLKTVQSLPVQLNNPLPSLKQENFNNSKLPSSNSPLRNADGVIIDKSIKTGK